MASFCNPEVSLFEENQVLSWMRQLQPKKPVATRLMLDEAEKWLDFNRNDTQLST
jgi:hypothetical protein